MFREQPSTHSRVPDQLGLLRLERILKHVVSHVATLLDAGRFVERPVNAQVNATLTVLFLRLETDANERGAERREGGIANRAATRGRFPTARSSASAHA